MLPGSSPLTQGKPRPGLADGGSAGLIPAHAGKTRAGVGRSPRARAHPRSRGENLADGGPKPAGEGSSPLTRGKQCVITLPSLIVGLIPTHAGKTPRSGSRACGSGAHPHSRGENEGAFRDLGGHEGSSPLTRGKHVECEQIPRLQGLIPTHAGKTNPSPGAVSRRTAHPRSCGETIFQASCLVALGVPPRSHGENSRSHLRVCAQAGSSPLTQGKPHARGRNHRLRGLIPAHTGKTW